MKPEHVVAMGVRLFSIVLGLYAIREAIVGFSYYNSDEASGLFPYLYLGLMLFMLLVAVILWRFPLTVSHNLLSFRRTDSAHTSPITASQLQIIGFTLLGLYLFSQVLSSLVRWLLIWFMAQRSHTPLHLTDGEFSGLITTGIQLAFSLFLIFGAKRLDALLRKR